MSRQKGAMALEKKEAIALAKECCPEAIKKLIRLMRHGETQSLQLAAANALLDRGIGKPFQAVGVDVSAQQHWIVSWSDVPVYDPALIDAKPSDNS